MSTSYQVVPGITYNQPGQRKWPGLGQFYDGVEGGNMTALNIYIYMAIITTTREIHGMYKNIGLMQLVIISSLRKFTLAGNLSTDWSGTCLTKSRVQGDI